MMLQFPRWKIILILSVCFAGFLAAMPNLFTREQVAAFPGWLPHKQISLGLDLRGGAHLLLEVDLSALTTERLSSLMDSVRDVMRPKPNDAGQIEDRIGYTGLRVEGKSIVLQLTDPSKSDQALKLIRGLSTMVGGKIGLGGTPDIDVEATPQGLITITLTEAALAQRASMAVDQSIEIVRRRVDEMGTREPTIQRQGTDRILVQVPGLGDPKHLKEIIGKTAKMTFRMVDTSMSVQEAEQGHVPPGSEILESAEGGKMAGMKFLVRKRVLVSGDSLIDSQPSFQSQTNEPVVSFKFDSAGSKRFAEATRDNVGKPFAIVLDNKVISAPNIREPILGGQGVISGSFTIESANELALLLRAGALPAPLTVLEERSVGPDLGADSVQSGKMAFIYGFLAVGFFMFVTYGWFGILADAALVVNMVLIFGALSFLGATLTLPGIAGMVLTMGMAVDANVLIFERLREELRLGKTPVAAVEAGFSRAMSTIIDSNVTTLIAAAILYELGAGPVKGFAVTLSIGIITSVFSAVTLTRLAIAVWLRRRRPHSITI
jgi:preprotein translocase subunit SecD